MLLIWMMAICDVYSQEIKLSESVISTAEQLADDETDPEAVAVYIEKLNELTENPVKINSPDQNEIARLFFLSDFQVKALIDYVKTSGKIVSVFELATIPGFDRDLAEMLIPFISLDYKSISFPDSSGLHNSILTNLSLKSGSADTNNLGSKWKVLTKYSFRSGAFSGGITAEKDPGEILFSSSPPLPDFFSAYLAYSGENIIKKIIVGDFSVRYGQGTNINTGIRRGISLTSPGYMSASDEIKPYTSTDENRFFRGIATELSLKKFDLSIFYSEKRIDATTVASNDSTDGYITSFYQSGLHNTGALQNKKDAVTETAYGMNLYYNLNNLKIGLTMSENKFSNPVLGPGDDPAGRFAFSGKKNDLFTFYYNGFLKNILLYGEISGSSSSKLAVVQGISFRPSDRLSINFLIRKYCPGFVSFYGNGPGSSSKNTNEKGLLGNFTFELAKHLFLSGGVDIQDYPWLRYRNSSPSRGARKELMARYLPDDKLTFEMSYSSRLSMVDQPEEGGIPGQNEINTRDLKGSVHYSPAGNISIGTKIEYKRVSPSGSRGVLLLQDISYRFRKLPVSLWFRYSVFRTGDWDARFYAYENDLLYSFSIPALSGDGSRSYIMLKWEPSDFGEIRIKYGITSLLTGGQQTKNTSELKVQFRIWF